MKLRVVEVSIGEYSAQMCGEVTNFRWEFVKDPNGVVLFSEDPELALLEGFKMVKQRVVIEGMEIGMLEKVYERQIRESEIEEEKYDDGFDCEGDNS